MPFCNAQLTCNTRIDYSTVTIGDRIIPFIVELDAALSNLTPGPGENQRFCYRLTGVGENISTYVSLSHWVLGICPHITLDQITNVTVIIDTEEQTVVKGENVELFIPPNVDPKTGCSGLKFDFGLSKVLGDEDSVGLFCFELTSPFPVGDVDVCLKGGQVTARGLSICGPVCSSSEECIAVASQLINVCVPVTVTPYAHIDSVSTICCGDPVIGDDCVGDPGGTCTFTVSQLICVEVPVHFGADAAPGDTYVQCDTATSGPCECPPEDENGD
ncbi:MAG: hypothetical protein ACOX0F_01400 [Syntrophomonadaceae bacterium]|jgi:hypothetical protein